MNAAQKKGVGMIVAIVVLAVPSILGQFGVALPPLVDTIAQIITTVCGIFGIAVNLPSNTNKA